MFQLLKIIIPMIFISFSMPTYARDVEKNLKGCEKLMQLTILHTNDTHAHAWQFKDEKGPLGGMAAASTLVSQIRKEVENNKVCGATLLVSAGDINVGDPRSAILNTEPDFKAMDIIEYDALTVGNHDFDKGIANLLLQRSWVGFPFLAANVFEKATGKPLLLEYIIKDYLGFKVGIIGLLTLETLKITSKEVPEKLELKEVIDIAKEKIDELTKKGVNLIIIVAHLGDHEKEKLSFGKPAGSYDLAKAITNVPVIIDGHQHAEIHSLHKVADSYIFETGAYGKYLGRVDLPIVDNKPVVEKIKGKLIEVRGFKQDPKILKMLANYENRPEIKSLSRKIAKTNFVIEEETLVNLVLDSMRKAGNSDIAILKRDSMRDVFYKGDISEFDILTVLVFNDDLIRMNLLGSDILDILAHDRFRYGDRVELRFSGLNWKRNLSYKNVKPEDVMIAGKILEKDKVYSVVTVQYLSNGGSGFSGFLNGKEKSDLKTKTADALINMIKGRTLSQKKLDSKQRIEIITK